MGVPYSWKIQLSLFVCIILVGCDVSTTTSSSIERLSDTLNQLDINCVDKSLKMMHHEQDLKLPNQDISTPNVFLDPKCITELKMYEEPQTGRSLLHIFIEKGDLELVKLLTILGADVNKASSNGIRPIWTAFAAKQRHIVAYLIATGGVNPDVLNWDGHSLLHAAARSGDVDLTMLLVGPGNAKIDTFDMHGHTPFRVACDSGNLVVADILKQNGAEANHVAEDGYTALSFAAAKGDMKTLQWLLRIEAWVDFPEKNPPIFAALREGPQSYMEIVDTLVRAGAKLENDIAGSALCTSLNHQRFPVAMYFMMHPWNSGTKFGRKALDCVAQAMEQNSSQAIADFTMWLLRVTNAPARTAEGTNVLFHSIRLGHTPLVVSLLNHGVSLTRTNPDNTLSHALSHAAMYGQLHIANHLIEAGASISAADSVGRTALWYAAYSGEIGVATLLLDRGADPTVRDSEGQTAIDVACTLCARRSVEFEMMDGILREGVAALQYGKKLPLIRKSPNSHQTQSRWAQQDPLEWFWVLVKMLLTIGIGGLILIGIVQWRFVLSQLKLSLLSSGKVVFDTIIAFPGVIKIFVTRLFSSLVAILRAIVDKITSLKNACAALWSSVGRKRTKTQPQPQLQPPSKKKKAKSKVKRKSQPLKRSSSTPPVPSPVLQVSPPPILISSPQPTPLPSSSAPSTPNDTPTPVTFHLNEDDELPIAPQEEIEDTNSSFIPAKSEEESNLVGLGWTPFDDFMPSVDVLGDLHQSATVIDHTRNNTSSLFSSTDPLGNMMKRSTESLGSRQEYNPCIGNPWTTTPSGLADILTPVSPALVLPQAPEPPTLCMRCIRAPAVATVVNCGHCILCDRCARTIPIRTCPVCGGMVDYLVGDQ